MKKQVSFNAFHVLLCFIYIFTGGVAKESSRKLHHSHHGSIKLFVFGDSYADTGNWEKTASSWKKPYGITFPGKPAGRFSDGRVLTDYLASYSGIKFPIPYGSWKTAKTSKKVYTKKDLKHGMNFAYGGTGVFDTLSNAPNMGTQIDIFQQLLEEKVYTKQDLNSSIALVSVAGNDYNAYIFKNNGDFKGMSNFTRSLINQLSISLKRIHSFGVRRIVVTSLQPLGCLPELAASTSYQNCSQTWNAASKFHNQILQKVVQKMNNESQKNIFNVLDLFGAFLSALNESRHAGSLNYGSPLRPCCMGKTKEYSCGNINKNGGENYEVFNNPELSVFWDMVHPSQNGWLQVYLALKSSLRRLLS